MMLATEKRLIDANVLKETVTTDYYEHFTRYHDTDQIALIDMVCDDIEEAPTVDAAEVVHGQWKHQYEKGMSYKVCSICGCRNGLDLKFNYCPNCGAKMDGERKDK